MTSKPNTDAPERTEMFLIVDESKLQYLKDFDSILVASCIDREQAEQIVAETSYYAIYTRASLAPAGLRDEDQTAYNAGEITALHKELIGPIEYERLGKTPWARSLVHSLVQRIANLRFNVKQLRAPAGEGEAVRLSDIMEKVTALVKLSRDEVNDSYNRALDDVIRIMRDAEAYRAATLRPRVAPHYAVFEAGWSEGFQEAQRPDRFPSQNRCEVRYRERFPDAPHLMARLGGDSE